MDFALSSPNSRLPWVVFTASLLVGCTQPKVERAGGATPGTGPGSSAGSTGSAGAPGAGGAAGAGSAADAGFFRPPPATGSDGAAGAGMIGEGEKACAAQAFTPEKVPVDMHILVDSSLSMGLPAGDRTKWQRAVMAMNAFIGDPRSAGLGVGLTFFPNRTPTNINTCRLDYYTTPAVNIAPLPMNAAPLMAAINARQLWGDTATRPGMEGVLGNLRAHAAMNPNRRPIFLLVTDGLPNGCGATNTVDAIADFLRAARAAAPMITTYAIGVFGDDRAMGEPAMNSWAAAGGSGRPFVLSATDDLGQRLLDALNEVRGAALACQFAVPTNVPMIDFMKVNVRVQSNGGAEDLGYVRTADRCDPVKGGWYYDVDPATSAAPPTRVIVCDATCNRYKVDATAKVDLLFGCKTRIIE